MIPTVKITCTAFGQKGEVLVGARFEAVLDRLEIYNGFVVPEKIYGYTDENGVCVLEVWPNALGANGSGYTIKGWDVVSGRLFLDSRMVVPNSDCILEQILVAEPFPPVSVS